MNEEDEVLRKEIRNSWERVHLQKVVDTYLNFDYVGWLENKVIALKNAELAATVPAVASANTQSAVITQIAAEIERGAGLVASTDPDVVQCSMLNWARQLRAL
jgi:hypothetical protein